MGSIVMVMRCWVICYWLLVDLLLVVGGVADNQFTNNQSTSKKL